MCGRYYIEIEDSELRSIIAEVERNSSVNTGEIYPTNNVPVQAKDGSITVMRWGFPRFDGKGVIINARSETASSKTVFARPMMEGRCLVPASWYFEWEKRGVQKVKYALMPQGGTKFDSKTGEHSFVILTRPAWDGISFIHDRMPVILPKECHDEWLSGHDPEGTMKWAINEMEYKAV
jgi:putative SOS response-associated peptidase YedK